MSRPIPAWARRRSVVVGIALLVTTASILLGGVGYAVGAEPDRGTGSPAGDALTPDWAAPPVTTLAQASPRPLREASHGGLLELLVRLLPMGQVSAASRIAGPGSEVLLRYTRNGTDSYVTLGLSAADPDTMKRGCTAPLAATRCTVLPNGAIGLLHDGTSCQSRLRAEVHRLDGVRVKLDVGSCTGYTLPPRPDDPRGRIGTAGRGLLQPDEVQLIASDDLWGMFLRSEFVSAGNRHFGTVPTLPPRS